MNFAYIIRKTEQKTFFCSNKSYGHNRTVERFKKYRTNIKVNIIKNPTIFETI